MIALDREAEFAVLRIDRPAALNALSFDLIRDLGDAIARAETSGARALIVTGAGVTLTTGAATVTTGCDSLASSSSCALVAGVDSAGFAGWPGSGFGAAACIANWCA